jgi:1-acyl-sn-glycerol-3-phosphate acyltransferase
MAQWFSYLWWYIVYWASAAFFIFGFRLRVAGGRHIPRQGPALLIANHQSFFDPVLVGLAAPRPLRYLARKTLFRHPKFTALIRSLGAVPIDQEGLGKEGLQTILEQLKAGQAVLVFPEGHRTADGKMLPLMAGVQLLIRRARVPVVPVGIAGAFDAWPRRSRLPGPTPLFLPTSRGGIAVAVGRPLEAAALAELPRDRLLRELAAELQRVHEQAERLRR